MYHKWRVFKQLCTTPTNPHPGSGTMEGMEKVDPRGEFLQDLVIDHDMTHELHLCSMQMIG